MFLKMIPEYWQELAKHQNRLHEILILSSLYISTIHFETKPFHQIEQFKINDENGVQ